MNVNGEGTIITATNSTLLSIRCFYRLVGRSVGYEAPGGYRTTIPQGRGKGMGFFWEPSSGLDGAGLSEHVYLAVLRTYVPACLPQRLQRKYFSLHSGPCLRSLWASGHGKTDG